MQRSRVSEWYVLIPPSLSLPPSLPPSEGSKPLTHPGGRSPPTSTLLDDNEERNSPQPVIYMNKTSLLLSCDVVSVLSKKKDNIRNVLKSLIPHSLPPQSLTLRPSPG